MNEWGQSPNRVEFSHGIHDFLLDIAVEKPLKYSFVYKRRRWRGAGWRSYTVILGTKEERRE
jgi:hypothetical protein